MQLRRNFDRQNKYQVGRQLRDAANAYREADNKPGDLDGRVDRVSLQVEGGNVQAILGEDIFLERHQAEDGRVTLSWYSMPPWYDPFNRADGLEVQKQGESVEGQTLDYTVGWTASFHHHEEMKEADAQGKFADLQAQFT